MAPRITAKPPKGTRDIQPEAMAIRERAFNLIKTTFTNHGAVQIDTPVFELREVLQNKYGEDSKLIYNLADDMTSGTGEKLSLRYDLSVPFARYIASYNVQNIKRFHIGKVYRRDRPAIERGRFREFFQCDFDIAGQAGIVADAEVVTVMMELFDSLSSQSAFHEAAMGSYRIKISHRAILDAVLGVCGVPDDKLRTICSAVDKLDKEPWPAVRAEMLEKGLSMEAADAIEPFVSLAGSVEDVLAELRKSPGLVERCEKALDDMERLFKLVECMHGNTRKLSFDLSLARGLDYYTGVIFEAVLVDNERNLGSIGAGGRYDNLVGMFRKNSIPCVGCSLGVERILSVMIEAEQARAKENGNGIRAAKTEAMVASVGKGTMEWRVALAGELWKQGVAAEFCYSENWSLGKQVTAAVTSGIPVLVVVGEDEVAAGVVKVKNLVRKMERVVERGNVASAVKEEVEKAGEKG